MIGICGLTKSYDGKSVLQGLDLTFPKGKVTAVMAPSGAGKTTLLRILLGLEKADSGEIRGLSGLRMSAVFQEDRLCENLSPVANIRLVNPRLKREEVLSAMASVGLFDCADQPCRELSGGMRRRVALLRALLAEYDLILLDEPFKGLDEETRQTVMEETRRRTAGKTVFLVTHDPEEAAAMDAASVVNLE